MGTTNTNPSSVLTSLRGLAELEKQRIASEQAAAAKRRADDAERCRREEDERVAVTAAAIERARLEHQAEMDARRAEGGHLREAERILARPRSETDSRPLPRPPSSLGLALRVAHGVAKATLALGLALALEEVHDAHRAQTLLARSAADDARALVTLRAENDELARNYGVALDAARNASRSLPALPAPPSAAAAVHRHDAVPPLPTQRRSTGCDPHDPLCGDLP